MGRVMFGGGKVGMKTPLNGLFLNTIAEGSIVKLNENGSPAEFYVAKHDYESTLNGTGRTLLVRKDCYDMQVWHSVNGRNPYANNDIDTWLNGTYKSVLDTNVQSAIASTKFYYTPGDGNTTVGTLSRAVFMLSHTEYGYAYTGANVEGSTLSIANILKVAYFNGGATNHWTRSPYTGNNSRAWRMTSSGEPSHASTTNSHGSRPCFTLPSNSLFDKKTLMFKGVA